MGVNPEIGGNTPKMDGENFMEKPLLKLMIWRAPSPIFGNTHMNLYFVYLIGEKGGRVFF